jgi:hypothetical protein
MTLNAHSRRHLDLLIQDLTVEQRKMPQGFREALRIVRDIAIAVRDIVNNEESEKEES